MAWITPVTNFTSSSYYNYSDLNRVENNTIELQTLIGSYSTTPTLGSTNTSRTNATIEFYDSLNRLENNIDLIRQATFTPIGWLSPKLDWTSCGYSFDYVVANRLESNLLALKGMIDNIKDNLMYCGAVNSICGNDNTIL